MQEIFYIFAKTVSLVIDVVSISMFLRMILSLFSFGEPTENRLYMLSCYITEPFIMPVRFIMAKLNVLQNSPIDWSFTFAYLLIIFLRFVLPAV